MFSDRTETVPEVYESDSEKLQGNYYKKLAFLASSKGSWRLSTKPFSAKYEQTLNLSIQKEFAATEYKEGNRIQQKVLSAMEEN